MGKPVIATAVGGIPEIVDSGVTGYLHQHGDSKELAAAIIALVEDPEKAKLIGRRACEHVSLYYSRHKFVEDISNAYADVTH